MMSNLVMQQQATGQQLGYPGGKGNQMIGS